MTKLRGELINHADEPYKSVVELSRSKVEMSHQGTSVSMKTREEVEKRAQRTNSGKADIVGPQW